MDDKLKCGIASIRFPMALLVVLIHCTLNTEQPFLKAFMNGGGKLATIAVPIFFFLSGYLFQEGNSNLEIYKKKIRKRVGSVLVPYIVFNIFAITVHYIKFPCDINVGNFLYRLIVEPQDFPLWYLQNLMVLFLLTPLIMLPRKKWLDFSYLALTIIVFCSFEGDKVLFLKVRNWGFCFYNIGAFCNRYFHDLLISKHVAVLYFILGMAAFVASIVTNKYYLIQYYNLFIVLLLVFNLRAVGKIFSVFKSYSKYSSFIYFSHTILVAGVCVNLVNRCFCNIIGYMVTPLLVAAILIIVYKTLNRLMPNTFSLIIGSKVKK